MPTVLLIFESLGMSEMLLIGLIALIIFGPRKLPEIGRTVGKTIAEFKRASDEFKRTWEYEVELEQRKPALDAPRTTSEQEVAAVAPSQVTAQGVSAEEFVAGASQYNIGGETVARNSSYPWADEPAAAGTNPRPDGEEEDEINAS